MIRRQATTFFRAVSDLKARSRWCLTGTPIQNRLEDIGALFAFIRARPFDSMAVFRRFVAIPFDESEERRRLAVHNLTLLLESLCLRRSTILLNLPEKQDRVRMVEFSPKEREQYEKTTDAMNRALRHRVGEEFTKSKFGLFQIQLQLRILCNHGTYQPEFSWARRSLLDEREDALCSMGSRSEVRCSACSLSISMLGSDNLYRSYTAKCIHILCSECLDQAGRPSEDEPLNCPLCMINGVSGSHQSASTIKTYHDNYLLKEGNSSKMDALIEDVRKDIEITKRQVTRQISPHTN
jgi:SWI/SNF-related matrix-associated actin-dependent regulator of chromatin subfamily A3